MTKWQKEPAASSGDVGQTGPRLSERLEAESENAPTGRLRVVTVAPAEPDSGNGARASGRDQYLGAMVDGRYQVETVLGEGGMGIVYRCTHTIIGKKVAMKVLRADLAKDSEVTERFLNEARAASAIGNPHIIDISDFGQFPDRATYFVMEYLSGIPLSKLMDGQTCIPLTRLLHIARQLCDGLSAAHAAGIVHRDLKPDNIFLIERGAHEDFVKILDFGIAKVSTGEKTRLTRAGAVFGTPHYMSPEQALGNAVDQRGDVYALGVILYEMASGRVPFDADSFMGILTQHLYKAPVALGSLEPRPPEVSPGLDAIVLKCLSKRADDRYQDMDALGADLERLERGVDPLALREMLERSQGFAVPADYFDKAKGSQKKRRTAALLALALATLLAALALGLSLRSAEREPGTAGTAAALSPIAPEISPPGGSAPRPVVVPEAKPLAVTPPKQVVLAVEPLDAHVFRGAADLGTSPVVLDVADGERVTLELKRDGYADESVTLDGSKPREVVRLHPLARPSPPRAAPRPGAKPAASAKKRTPIGGDEIVNPWGR